MANFCTMQVFETDFFILFFTFFLNGCLSVYILCIKKSPLVVPWLWKPAFLRSLSSPKIALQLKSNEDGKDGKQVR